MTGTSRKRLPKDEICAFRGHGQHMATGWGNYHTLHLQPGGAVTVGQSLPADLNLLEDGILEALQPDEQGNQRVRHICLSGYHMLRRAAKEKGALPLKGPRSAPTAHSEIESRLEPYETRGAAIDTAIVMGEALDNMKGERDAALAHIEELESVIHKHASVLTPTLERLMIEFTDPKRNSGDEKLREHPEKSLEIIRKRIHSRVTHSKDRIESLLKQLHFYKAECEMHDVEVSRLKKQLEETLGPASDVKEKGLLEDLNRKLADSIIQRNSQIEALQQALNVSDAKLRETQQKLQSSNEELSKVKAESQIQLEKIAAELDDCLFLLSTHWEDSDSDSDEEPVCVPLIKTKVNNKEYDANIRIGLQHIGRDFNISGKDISMVVYRSLSIATGWSLEELQEVLPLPSASTIYRDTTTINHLEMGELRSRVTQGSFFTISFDGGDKGGDHRVSILISYPSPADETTGECIPQQNILAVPTLLDHNADGYVSVLVAELENFGVPLLKLVACTTDATTVNPATIRKLASEKLKLVERGIADNILAYPTYLSEHDQIKYFIFRNEAGQQPEDPLLYPIGIEYINDITHGLKNAELKQIAAASEHLIIPLVRQAVNGEALTLDVLSRWAEARRNKTAVEDNDEEFSEHNDHFGEESGLDPLASKPVDKPSIDEAAGEPNTSKRKKGNTGSNGLLCIGRFIGRYSKIVRALVKRFAPSYGLPKLPKVPGRISHRFNIKTKIACIVLTWYEPLLKAFMCLASMYSGTTKLFANPDRESMMKHLKEVLSYMLNPHFKLFFALMAAFVEEAEKSYSRFNRHGGFKLAEATSLLQETASIYTDIGSSLKDPSNGKFQSFTTWAWPSYCQAFGVAADVLERYGSSAWLTDNFKLILANFDEVSQNIVPAEVKEAAKCFRADLEDFLVGINDFNDYLLIEVGRQYQLGLGLVASWWDPKCGLDNLRRHLHCSGHCTVGCIHCISKEQIEAALSNISVDNTVDTAETVDPSTAKCRLVAHSSKPLAISMIIYEENEEIEIALDPGELQLVLDGKKESLTLWGDEDMQFSNYSYCFLSIQQLREELIIASRLRDNNNKLLSGAPVREGGKEGEIPPRPCLGPGCDRLHDGMTRITPSSTMSVERSLYVLGHIVFSFGVGSQGEARTLFKVHAGAKVEAVTQQRWDKAVKESGANTAPRFDRTAEESYVDAVIAKSEAREKRLEEDAKKAEIKAAAAAAALEAKATADAAKESKAQRTKKAAATKQSNAKKKLLKTAAEVKRAGFTRTNRGIPGKCIDEEGSSAPSAKRRRGTATRNSNKDGKRDKDDPYEWF